MNKRMCVGFITGFFGFMGLISTISNWQYILASQKTPVTDVYLPFTLALAEWTAILITGVVISIWGKYRLSDN